MNWITSRLALGTLDDGRNPVIADHFDQILNVSQYDYFSAVPMMHLPMQDEIWLGAWVWQERLKAIEVGLRQGQKLLVHCRLGKSRSPALVVAWLARAGMGLAEAHEYVCTRHPTMHIHSETWRSLEDWWKG